MYKYILFDLDGTLTDPAIGITNSVMYALEKFGIETHSREELYKFIGPPLVDSFMNFYGLTPEKAQKAVDYYREYFKPKGIYENSLYDGVKELLGELKEQNKSIILATSKPLVFAKEILRYFDLEKYFSFVAGATMDSSRSKKADVIRYALEECQITDLNEAIMVGDREQDIFGAAQNNIKAIGVLYGYGSLQELKNAGADFIAATLPEILNYI